jgi:DNA polymerase I
MLGGQLSTVFGWRLQANAGVNPRSLRNFPMQSGGAEMMRLACCLTTEQGISVCGVVHDALLVEANDTDINQVVVRTQEAMRHASELVLPDFPLRTEASRSRSTKYRQEAGPCLS